MLDRLWMTCLSERSRSVAVGLLSAFNLDGFFLIRRDGYFYRLLP